MNKGTVIGIDLGTATTEAAVFRNGKPEMIRNPEGKIVTPSVVGLDESGNFIVGEKAKAQYLMAPERTAIEVKRKIGSGERIRLGRQSFTPVELSARLLEYVRNYASEYLEEEISRAVISVPAYFDDIQRQAVVEAGTRAGFTVERIINEPTAAALSYGIAHMEEESHILIYDLGGGTFDVTLLELFEGVLEVKASSGDNQLGGKDIDERLIGWLRERFEGQYGISLEGNTYAMARLKEQAEQGKIALSIQEEASIRIPFLAEKDGMPLVLDEVITCGQLEELIHDLIERTHHPIQVVLDDSGIDRENLDLVLLVGGSTRIPMVSRDIEEFLGMKPKTEIDPDYSVAEGAAIQAGIISGAIDQTDSIVMTDVNPYTLGVRALSDFSDDCMSVIIPRNVTIPVTRHRQYYTAFPNQEIAQIDVYQGESRIASRNHRLGTCMVEGIPQGPAGKEAVDVAFSYNQNGILHVSAVLVSTGETVDVSIDMMQAGIGERIDVSGWKQSPMATEYRSILRRSEKFLKNTQAETMENEAADSRNRELEELIYQLKKAILEGNLEEADYLEDEIRDLMEEEGHGLL